MKRSKLPTITLTLLVLLLLTSAPAAGAQEGQDQQGYLSWSDNLDAGADDSDTGADDSDIWVDDPGSYGWIWNEPGKWQQTPTGQWLYCWDSHGVPGYEGGGPNDSALYHTCASNPPS